MNTIAISSGHGKYIRGASGYIDEVDEARKVVNRVVEYLKGALVGVTAFHDDVSDTQSENLDRIVDFHNGCERDLDVSVHFNAYETTSGPMGCEVLYVTQDTLAERVCDGICEASEFKNRGAKKRTDLKFLNATDEPSILIEVCFVDSQTDVDLYRAHFSGICAAIASEISGVEIESDTPLPPSGTPPPPSLTPVPVVTITVDPPDAVKFILK
jgi:N-acetylmuramoyl-L-alanine amidase